MKNWIDLLPKLRAIGFRPNLLVRLEKKHEVVYGIWVQCTPILMKDWVERMKGVIGEDYVYTEWKNQEEIHITEKKPNT